MGAFKNQSANAGGKKAKDNSIINAQSLDRKTIEQQNAIVLKWTPQVKNSLRSSARWFSDGKSDSMVIRNNGKQIERKLADSIDSKIRKDYSLISSVSFQFERHGVFVHKGVGRGYKATGTELVVRTALGPIKRKRVAVEWFNPILDKKVPILADQIATINADAAVNATRMKI